ncbi:MAG: hypothetical protein HOV79_15855 [Hamadaea sp.]|nr:hypothetical protein [Hamadaea sp.]
MRRSARLTAVTAVTLVTFSLSGYACRPEPTPPSPTPSAGPVTPTAAAPRPAYFTLPVTKARSGLRLLASGAVHDVDRGPGVARPVGVTAFLPRGGRAPLLLDERVRGDRFGTIRLSARREPGLPGSPVVLVVERPAVGSVAAADNDDLWIEEYASAASCTIRRARPDGRIVQAARPVPCGMRPLAQNGAGLWLTVGPDAITGARAAGMPEQTRVVLADPATFAERARFAWAAMIDGHRTLVAADRSSFALGVHDARTGAVTPVNRPGHWGWPEPEVGVPSPDGRWLPLTFAEPGDDPQVIDVWLLDLTALTWTRVPAMPALGYLKPHAVAWARDGRLVVAYRFAVSRGHARRLVLTWKPAEAAPAAYPYDHPLENMLVR